MSLDLHTRPVEDLVFVKGIIYLNNEESVKKIESAAQQFLDSSEQNLIDGEVDNNVCYIAICGNFDEIGLFICLLGTHNLTFKFIKNENFSIGQERIWQNHQLEWQREVGNQGTGSQGDLCNSVYRQGCGQSEVCPA